MDQKYDYNYLIKLSNKMGGAADEIESPYVDLSYDDWDEIREGAFLSVKEKLFEFIEDKQRFFFIKNIFENVFHESNNIFFLLQGECMENGCMENNNTTIQEGIDRIKNYRVECIKENWEPESYIMPWDKFYLHEASRWYVIRCFLCLYNFTNKISEICFEYKINFENIIDTVMIWNGISSGDIRKFFFYQISTGEYMIRGELENNAVPNDVKIVPLSPIKFSSIFKPKYQDKYKMFFEALKKSKPAYMKDENIWCQKSHALQYFYILQNEPMNIIKPTLKAANVAKLFAAEFNMIESTFVKNLALSDDIKEDFEAIIKDVKWQIDNPKNPK